MDISSIQTTINNCKTINQLNSYKSELMGQIENQLENIGLNIAQVSLLTNPTTLLAALASQFSQLLMSLQNQLQEIQNIQLTLTNSFSQKEQELT